MRAQQSLPRIMTTVLIAAAAFGSLSLGATAYAAAPNILYILADDLGSADCGFAGGKTIATPALDKLAREGTILDDFYVQPVCSPTRAALMTGRYAVHTGVYTIVTPGAPWGLPLAERTLANALHDAGYETALCGKWHLGEFQPEYRPTRRGFDHQYGLWFGMIDYFTHHRGEILDWHRDDEPCQDEGYSTHLIAKEACRMIRERKGDRPLFLYLPFNAVHSPHQVPEKYTEPYGQLSGDRRQYAGMLAAMDEAVSQVIATLEEEKLKDNTLILFSSDNGGPAPGKVTDNGTLRAGKGTLYEGGVRVSAFAHWPGHIPAGQHVREPLHIVDWYPTLVKLSGAPAAQSLPPDGRDIWPVLTEKARSPHEAILLCGLVGPMPCALRAGDWKLIVGAAEREADSAGDNRSKTQKVELYNLADDPGEKQDLAAAHPEKVEQLRAEMDRLSAGAVAPGGRAEKLEKKPGRKRAAAKPNANN